MHKIPPSILKKKPVKCNYVIFIKLILITRSSSLKYNARKTFLTLLIFLLL